MRESVKYVANLLFLSGFAVWSVPAKFALKFFSDYQKLQLMPQYTNITIVFYFCIFILGAILIYIGWSALRSEEYKKRWYLKND